MLTNKGRRTSSLSRTQPTGRFLSYWRKTMAALKGLNKWTVLFCTDEDWLFVTKGEKAKCVVHCFWQPRPVKNNRNYFRQNKLNRNGRKEEVKVEGKLKQVCEDIKSGMVRSSRSQPSDELLSVFPAFSFSCLRYMQDFKKGGEVGSRCPPSEQD